MFMHNGIQSFGIQDNDSRSETIHSITSFCIAISTRMPRLLGLCLFLLPVQIYTKPILTLIQQLPNLKLLTIPSFEDQTTLMFGLRNTPGVCLRSLDMYQSDKGDISSILEGPHQRIGFSKLREVNLCCTYAFAAILFRNFTRHNSMKIISIVSAIAESSHDIRILISEIVSSFSSLVTLELLIAKDLSITYHLPCQPSAKDMVGLGDLIPIFNRYPNLTRFSLRTPYPLALDDTEVEIIAESWPHLEVLSLCDQPAILFPGREKHITMKALSHLSRCCPKISTVGLYVDATSDYIPDFNSVSIQPFKNLRKLAFGPSPIDHPTQVARALLRLCPGHLKLTSGSCYEKNTASSSYSVWKAKWEFAGEMLEVLQEMEEKTQKVTFLEEEIEQLRQLNGQQQNICRGFSIFGLIMLLVTAERDAVDSNMENLPRYRPSKTSHTPRSVE